MPVIVKSDSIFEDPVTRVPEPIGEESHFTVFSACCGDIPQMETRWTTMDAGDSDITMQTFPVSIDFSFAKVVSISVVHYLFDQISLQLNAAFRKI